jgi:hypothetical protein
MIVVPEETFRTHICSNSLAILLRECMKTLRITNDKDALLNE